MLGFISATTFMVIMYAIYKVVVKETSEGGDFRTKDFKD